MSSEILAAAIAYLAAGLSVFPLPYAEKVPRIAWRVFQSSRATVTMATRWFTDGMANIAIVMGRISGNAVALDFDDPVLARRAFPNLGELLRTTFVERTSRGYHVLFRIDGETARTTTFVGKGFALDIKGESSYIVASPSTHPDGTRYELLSPDVRIATIPRSEFDALILRLLRKQSALPELGLSFCQPNGKEGVNT